MPTSSTSDALPPSDHASLKQTPLRILIWSPGGAGPHYHGPGTSAYRLFQAVAAQQAAQLTLVHGSASQDSSDVFSEVIAFPNVDPTGNRLRDYLNQLRFLFHAINWLKQNAAAYDVMYCTASNILTLHPGVIAKRRGLPVVCRIALAGTELRDNGRIRSLLGWTQRRTRMMAALDRTIAISKFIERRLLTLGIPAEKVVHIPNSADCDRFRPSDATEKASARVRFGIPPDAALVLLCVGGITNRKGQHIVARSLQLLPANVHLLCVGPDRDADIVAELTDAQDDPSMRRRIHRVAHINDIEQAYFAADVFVLPSSDEGMPNAMVEAMACGLPCMGTPISGIYDLLGNGERGVLINRTPESIAAAALKFIENRSLYELHGRRARSFVVTNQSRSAVADQTYELLRAVASAANAPNSSATRNAAFQ